MDRFKRIFALHGALAGRRTPISHRELEGQLECSRATVTRVIAELRDQLGAPIRYDRARGGYYYATTTADGPYELPGLWFNASELYALLATQELLSRVQPGLLDQYLAPARTRLDKLLDDQRTGVREAAHRIRILQMAPRTVDVDQFRLVADALVTRQRLHVFYHGRARDETTERTVSPQRLVYYRDNWYLDAWCHTRRDMRSFSLDRLHAINLVHEPAHEVDDAALDAQFTNSYGIFAGTPKHEAVLRFSADAARWVADEQWHSDQQATVLPGGALELRIPYNDAPELVMDILKYGADIEVLAPASLRKLVAKRLQAALAQYA